MSKTELAAAGINFVREMLKGTRLDVNISVQHINSTENNRGRVLISINDDRDDTHYPCTEVVIFFERIYLSDKIKLGILYEDEYGNQIVEKVSALLFWKLFALKLSKLNMRQLRADAPSRTKHQPNTI